MLTKATDPKHYQTFLWKVAVITLWAARTMPWTWEDPLRGKEAFPSRLRQNRCHGSADNQFGVQWQG